MVSSGPFLPPSIGFKLTEVGGSLTFKRASVSPHGQLIASSVEKAELAELQTAVFAHSIFMRRPCNETEVKGLDFASGILDETMCRNSCFRCPTLTRYVHMAHPCCA
jgi:hypothetical protein